MSVGVPYVTNYLSPNAKVILCRKGQEDWKPAKVAADDYKYGAQNMFNSIHTDLNFTVISTDWPLLCAVFRRTGHSVE